MLPVLGKSLFDMGILVPFTFVGHVELSFAGEHLFDTRVSSWEKFSN
jgi:hypothetical protein